MNSWKTWKAQAASNPSICTHLTTKGRCRDGGECKFILSETRQTCKGWKGSCRFGSECHFSHLAKYESKATGNTGTKNDCKTVEATTETQNETKLERTLLQAGLVETERSKSWRTAQGSASPGDLPAKIDVKQAAETPAQGTILGTSQAEERRPSERPNL
jgi:hypothetical protein